MIDIRTLPEFKPSMTSDQRIALVNEYYARQEEAQKVQEAQETALLAKLERVHELLQIAAQSRRCLPLAVNQRTAKIGYEADQKRADAALDALTLDELKTYGAWRRAQREA